MKQTVVLVGMVLTLTFGRASSALSQWGGWVQTKFATMEKGGLAGDGSMVYAGVNYDVLRSSDNGETWANSASAVPNTFVQAVAVKGSLVFAGTSDSGVFRSTDHGVTWLRANAGLTAQNVYSLAATQDLLYAGTDSGVFRSTNNGLSWSRSNTGIEHWAILSLFTRGSTMLAGTWGGGMFRSSDYGATWTVVDTSSIDANVLAFASSASGTIYSGTIGRLIHSTDDGLTWNPIDSQPTSGITCLLTRGNDLFAGTPGAGGDIYLSNDGGTSWSEVTYGEPHRVQAIVISGPNLIAGSSNVGIWYFPLANLSGVETAPAGSTAVTTYPNPLCTHTTIAFSTEQREFVDVRIVNVLGEECAQLFSGELDAGKHSFVWEASRMQGGLYYCTVHVGHGIDYRKLVVVR